MQLYLMQHGEATTEDENPDRPLTERGRVDVTRVASQARASGVLAGTIVHSGKLRAEQSARILADALATSAVTQRAGLAPNDPVGPIAEWLAGQDEVHGMAIVGHQPFLGRLAALLVADDEEAEAVEFHMGGLVISADRSQSGRMFWLMRKKFSGSHCRLSALRRSNFAGP